MTPTRRETGAIIGLIATVVIVLTAMPYPEVATAVAELAPVLPAVELSQVTQILPDIAQLMPQRGLEKQLVEFAFWVLAWFAIFTSADRVYKRVTA